MKKKNTLRGMLATIVLLVPFIVHSNAQNQEQKTVNSCALLVNVTDSSASGVRISTASVYAKRDGTRKIVRPVLVGGLFLFSRLEEGEYSIAVSKRGFETSLENHDLRCADFASVLTVEISKKTAVLRLTNPALPLIISSPGDGPRPITNEPLRIPAALSSDRSESRGSGGGIGWGSGQGSGVGSFEGAVSGSGIGSGPSDKQSGQTSGVKIISKPRALYTEVARRQGIQGKVVLRVTFQADGKIGAISPLSGLEAGLTERAIAAAREIRFEPAMKNGVPYSVTKTIEYTFTNY